MQTDSSRIEYSADLARPGRWLAVGTAVAAWGWMFFYDLFVGGYDAPPSSFNLLRLLIPLMGLLPSFVRLFRLDDLEDDQQAYTLFVRMTTILLISSCFLLLFGLLPIDLDDRAAAENIWAFLVSRVEALVAIVIYPILAEQILQLFRYRSRRGVPRLAIVFTWAWIAAGVLGQSLPFDDGDTTLPTAVKVLALAMMLPALVLSARVRWLVNLRKRQKYNLLGLSFLGLIGAVLLIAAGGGTPIGVSLISVSPALPALGLALGFSMLIIQFAVCFYSLIALPTAGAIDRRNTEVSSLTTFARLLTQSFDIEDLADTAITIACDVTASSVAWIEITGPEGEELLFGRTSAIPIELARQLTETPTERRAPLWRAVRDERRVVVVDRVRNGTWSDAGTNRQICTVAAAPLRSGEEILGTLYVAKERGQGYERDDLMILDAVADQVALSLDHSRLIRSSIQRERLEREMMIARDLQQRLLPRQMPQSEWYEIYAESQPASMVGGDYYDIVSFSDGTLGLVIADVSGKGASAALYMGMIKGIIQSLSGSSVSPKELLSRVNVALYGNIDQKWFVTMTCAKFDEENRTLRMVRAGHCPTLLIRSGTASYSRPKGLGVAIARPLMFEKNLEEEEVRFESGDYAIFLSDGIPEATAPGGEELGYERLLEIAQEAARESRSSRELRDVIFAEISRFTQGELPSDDSTIAIVRWR